MQSNGINFYALDKTKYQFTPQSALNATKSIGRGEAQTISGLPFNYGVKVGDVGSYKIIQHLEKTGDGLTGDHQPSGASIKEAIRLELHQKLNQVLTRSMARTAYLKAITIVVTDKWHKKYSRTYGGRNTHQQISSDAADLAKAAMDDFIILVDDLVNSGYSPDNIQVMYEELDEARQHFFSTGNMFYSGFDQNKTPSFSYGSQSKRCSAKTHAGHQCTRQPKPGSDRCFQH